MPANEHAQLRKRLLEAGVESGIREIGFLAMFSLRLEKSIGIWSAEFTQGYTPKMTGLDRWIDWSKPNFIGKQVAENEGVPSRVLTMLEVDAQDADAVGFEPIWQGDTVVGVTTSGAYGHRVGKSLALAMVDRKRLLRAQNWTFHIVGEKRTATVFDKCLTIRVATR